VNHWVKTVYGIAAVAALGWIAAGWLGPAARHEAEGLSVHTLVALAAALGWILADLWVPIYFAGCARALRRATGPGTLAATTGADKRRVAGLATGALVLTVGQLVLAGTLYPDGPPAWLHVTLAVGALLAQGGFLVFSTRALRRLDRAFESVGEVVPASD
jgi:hypothetical protein